MARRLHSALVIPSICSSGPLPVSVQQPTVAAFFFLATLCAPSNVAFFDADFLGAGFLRGTFFDRFFPADVFAAFALLEALEVFFALDGFFIATPPVVRKGYDGT
jgi:hypothetical protein